MSAFVGRAENICSVSDACFWTRSRPSLHPPMPSSGVAKARVLYSVTQLRRPNDRSAATGIGSPDPDRNTRSRPVLPMGQSLAAQIAPPTVRFRSSWSTTPSVCWHLPSGV